LETGNCPFFYAFQAKPPAAEHPEVQEEEDFVT